MLNLYYLCCSIKSFIKNKEQKETEKKKDNDNKKDAYKYYSISK
jgi:hypothetical protein